MPSFLTIFFLYFRVTQSINKQCFQVFSYLLFWQWLQCTQQGRVLEKALGSCRVYFFPACRAIFPGVLYSFIDSQWLRILVHLFVYRFTWFGITFTLLRNFHRFLFLFCLSVSQTTHSLSTDFWFPQLKGKPFIIKGLEEKDKFPVAELSLLSSLQFQNKLPDSCQDGCFSSN